MANTTDHRRYYIVTAPLRGHYIAGPYPTKAVADTFRAMRADGDRLWTSTPD